MNRLAIYLFILALLIAVSWTAWTWFEDDIDLGPIGSAEAATVRDGLGPQGGKDVTDREAGDQRQQLDRAGLGTAPAEKEAGPPPPPGDSLTVLVRIVSADSGSVVPLAKVAAMSQQFNWPGMSDEDKELVNRLGRDNVRLFEHFGKVHQADAQGELRLRIQNRLFLACEHDGAFGELYLDASKLDVTRMKDSAHVLRLHPDKNLRVRVVSTAGKPMPGVPIGIRFVWRNRDVPDRESRSTMAWQQASTDDKGEATIKHLQEFVRELEKNGRPDRAAVRLSIPGLTEDAYVFDPMAPPRDVIELIAPATGTVELRARALDGSPIGTYEDLAIGLIKKPQQGRSSWQGRPAGPGAARFPYVVLGQSFRGRCTSDRRVKPREFSGPITPGETVQIVLEAEPAAMEIVGRLYGEDGKPLGRMHLQFDYESGEDGGRHRLTSQDDGRFWFEFDEALVGKLLTRAVMQHVKFFRNTPLLAEVHMSAPLRAGRNDLGNIVMREAPLIASGQVLVDGEPPTQRIGLSIDFLGKDRDGEMDWRRLRNAAVAFPKPGQFEVRGLAAPGRHRLVPDAPDCLPPELLEFHAGQRDLLVQLQQGGGLQVQVLLDDPSLAEDLVFTLRPQNPSPDHERALRWRGRSPGGELIQDRKRRTVAWRGLVPGNYRLILDALGAVAPVVTLANLVVPAGGRCEDGRIAPLDLRGKLRAINLVLADAAGRPFRRREKAVMWSSAGGKQTLAKWTNEGRTRILAAGPVDLSIMARGYQTTKLVAVTEDTTVRLQPLPTISLSLPAVTVPRGTKVLLRVLPAGLPEDWITARIGTRRYELVSLTKPSHDLISLGQPRVVPVQVRPGEEIKLQVVLELGNDWATVTGCAPERVFPKDHERPVALRVPAAAVQKALAKARR